MNNDRIIQIKKNPVLGNVRVDLPASKSIANRVLIIDALCAHQSHISNISKARDTQTMLRLLKSNEEMLNVLDAGTTMRFLTGYLSVAHHDKRITGTERMLQRPIKILVDALREIGVEINYLDREGFPPLEIKGLNKQLIDKIEVDGSVSSQYISSLLMIAPKLPEGLTILLKGKIGSKPYISMTLKLMELFGVSSEWHENEITISPQQYTGTAYTVEPDWSAASYWYSFISLAESGSVFLKNLKSDSLQGDSAIVPIMNKLGVDTIFEPEGATLSKCTSVTNLEIDFTDIPDMAQTIAVICAAKGIQCKMRGLESLRIKETDRIAALQRELGKVNTQLEEIDDHWLLLPGNFDAIGKIRVCTYDDHRMAMAFAPLATMINVEIEEPEVVNKSFPNYWDEMLKAKFSISEMAMN